MFILQYSHDALGGLYHSHAFKYSIYAFKYHMDFIWFIGVSAVNISLHPIILEVKSGSFSWVNFLSCCKLCILIHRKFLSGGSFSVL